MKINSNNSIFFLTFLIASGCILTFATIGWNKYLLQGGDQWGYNSYLVSTFINGDLKTLDATYEAKCREYNLMAKPRASKNRIEEAPDASNGNRVLKYYYGVAAMQAPFFFVTHLMVHGNGYSPPYVFAVYLSSAFYVILGLILLIRVLKIFVSTQMAMFSVVVLFFCSNLLYFSLCNPGLSHPYLFYLFACLAYCTIRFYENPSYKMAAIIGIIIGFIIITRAPQLIVVAIPILFGLLHVRQMIERIAFIRKHCWKFITALFFIFLVIVPQLIYWRASSGHWLYDSYPTESFDFLYPHILEGLFSFKNGWFTYTPLMIIPVIYLLPFLHKQNPFASGIIVYIIVYIYITYSWKVWNYNAGLGSRPMVETYALLVIPLSLGMDYLLKERKAKYITLFFLSVCFYLNILRTWQMQTGNFISEDATWQFNKQMLFKFKTNLNDVYAFDLNTLQPNSSALRFAGHLGSQDFEKTRSGTVKDTLNKMQGNQSAQFTSSTEFNDMVESSLDTTFHEGDYIKVSAWAYVPSFINHYRMGRIVINIQRGGKTVLWKSVRIHNKLTEVDNAASLYGGTINKWNQLSFFILVDKQIQVGDILKVYAWNPFGVDFWIDDLKVDRFKPKP